MSRWTEFFLSSPPSVVQLETLEISHPQFTKTYRIVRNAKDGITATLEDGATQATFDYLPCRIEPLGARANLDFGLRVDLGDLGEIIPQEIDRIMGIDLYPWREWYGSDDAFQAILDALNELVNEDLPTGVVLPSVFVFSVTEEGIVATVTAITAMDTPVAYLVTESSATPSTSDPGWSTLPLAPHLFSDVGAYTLYAWAKNASDEIGEAASQSVAVDAWYGSTDALAAILSGLSTTLMDLPHT